MKVTAALLAFSLVALPGAVPTQTASVAGTGDMTFARFDHTATLLADGRVLILGGLERNGVAEPTAELYDPATGRFSPAGKLQSPRGWGATAVRLRDGQVLIAGGSDAGCGIECYLATAELFDPATATFRRTANMTRQRVGARSVLLPDGDALILGGTDDHGAPATTELYHAGVFTAGPTMHISDPVAALLLRTGKVLVVGSTEAELYDPASRRFTSAGRLILPRTKFGAALLPDGRVLIVGGQTGGAWGPRTDRTEIYDPRRNAFAAGPPLTRDRFKLMHAVVTLPDGRVLIAGGADQPEVFDPAKNAFAAVSGDKLDGFLFSTATTLRDGRVLLVGGYSRGGGTGVRHAWLFRP